MDRKRRDIVLIIGAIVVLYIIIPAFIWLAAVLLGIQGDGDPTDRVIFKWLVAEWFVKDSHYSHGFLVLLISIFFIWKQRDVLKPLEKKSTPLVFAGGLFLYAAGFLWDNEFISATSLILVLSGLIIYFYGKDVMRKLLFPILFLFFMIPLYPSDDVNIDNISIDLQLFTAKSALSMLNIFGIDAIYTYTDDGPGMDFRDIDCDMTIGAQCSGLTTLVTFITLAVLFVYVIKTSAYRRVFILCLSFPIALFANVLRILVITLIAKNYGCEAAMEFFHIFSGIFSFIIGILILIFIAFLLRSLKFREDILR